MATKTMTDLTLTPRQRMILCVLMNYPNGALPTGLRAKYGITEASLHVLMKRGYARAHLVHSSCVIITAEGRKVA